MTRDDCVRFNEDFKKYKTIPRVYILYDMVMDLNSAQSELTVFKPESADSLIKVWMTLRGEIKDAIDMIRKKEDGGKELTGKEEDEVTLLATARTMLDTEIKLQRLMKSKMSDEKAKTEWRCVLIGRIVAVAVGVVAISAVTYFAPAFFQISSKLELGVKVLIGGGVELLAYYGGKEGSRWFFDFLKCYENSNRFKRELHLKIQHVRLSSSEEGGLKEDVEGPSSSPASSDQNDTLSRLMTRTDNPIYKKPSDSKASSNDTVALEIKNYKN